MLIDSQKEFVLNPKRYDRITRDKYYYRLRNKAKEAIEDLGWLSTHLPSDQAEQIFNQGAIVSSISSIFVGDKDKISLFGLFKTSDAIDEWRRKLIGKVIGDVLNRIDKDEVELYFRKLTKEFEGLYKREPEKVIEEIKAIKTLEEGAIGKEVDKLLGRQENAD